MVNVITTDLISNWIVSHYYYNIHWNETLVISESQFKLLSTQKYLLTLVRGRFNEADLTIADSVQWAWYTYRYSISISISIISVHVHSLVAYLYTALLHKRQWRTKFSNRPKSVLTQSDGPKITFKWMNHTCYIVLNNGNECKSQSSQLCPKMS